MDSVRYPPKCLPIGRTNDSVMEKRLLAIFQHFQSLQYPEKRNEINQYYSLWRELIKIGKTNENPRVRIAANLSSVEMFKFMYETENFDCYLREKCICTFYNNVANDIREIYPEKSDIYIWKYHILRTMSDHELFKIYSPVSLDEKLNDFIFKKLLRTFYEIGTRNDKTDHISSLANSCFQQLVQSYPIRSTVVLSELLPNLLKFKSRKYLMTSKAVKFLKFKDSEAFSKMIVDRLSKNETFNRELEMFEHFIQFVSVLSPFESSFEIILKSITDDCHENHYELTRILAVALLKMSELQSSEDPLYNQVLKRFYKAMVREQFPIYLDLLFEFGQKLVETSPSYDLKMRFLSIFYYYLKRCPTGRAIKLRELYNQLMA